MCSHCSTKKICRFVATCAIIVAILFVITFGSLLIYTATVCITHCEKYPLDVVCIDNCEKNPWNAFLFIIGILLIILALIASKIYYFNYNCGCNNNNDNYQTIP